MTQHHPHDDTLLRFAAGELGTGPSLIVATHMAMCAECRHTVRALEAVGGVLVEENAPVAMHQSAADLLAMDAQQTAAGSVPSGRRSLPQRTVRQAVALPSGMVLPAPLAACDIGAWRFVAPGIQWTKVSVPHDPSVKVVMLRARPGMALPMHTHTGSEYTCILDGSFLDEGESIKAGGLVECDEHLSHQPKVDSAVDCICVLAVDGRLVMSSWLARIAQRIVGL